MVTGGEDIITDSGRLQTIRTAEPAIHEPVDIIDADRYVRNLKKAWDRCNQMRRDGSDDKLVGYIFFKELEKIFGYHKRV